MRSLIFLLISAVFLTAACCGCSSIKVKRTDTSKTVDLSGGWNDSDSRMTAEEMIGDCLQRPWLSDFNIAQGKRPVVIVGTIINRTSEHINSGVFVNDLQRSLLNSGKVKFVSDSTSRQELRAEKADQAQYALKETAKPQYAETGADFMLQGEVNSVKDEIKGKYVVLYQINLELVNLTTNEKVWIGQKEIKKIVSRSTFGL